MRLTPRRLSGVGAIFAVVTFAMFNTMVPVSASSTGQAASLDQCTNGTVGPPLLAEPCVGSNAAGVTVAIAGVNSGAATSYKNWVNGNSNGSKSHWREGEYIAYRTTITGLTCPGAATSCTHTIGMSYDTVHSSGHAIDYLGSYDATETTSPTATFLGSTVIHANNNSPCSDLVAASQMPQPDCGTAYNPTTHVQTTAASPRDTLAIPTATTAQLGQSCGGAAGTFSGTQTPGTIDLFGPSGSTLVSFTYGAVSSGSTTCTQPFTVSFTAPVLTSSETVVLAWGGHIACGTCTVGGNWGFGNSAGSINGSPYHMALNTLDGASTGAQDRALESSAIVYTPTISTQVIDQTTGKQVPGQEATVLLGDTVYDTSIQSNGPEGATVTYNRFNNGTCTSPAATSEAVSVAADGTVPHSSAFTPTTAGSYSYDAVITGSNVVTATSSCEPFTVTVGTSTTSTTVFDAGTNAPWAGTELAGSKAYDTATVTTSPSSTPTGSVAYTFYANGTCGGTGSSAGGGALTAGAAPNSSTTGALADGSYSFKATFTSTSSSFTGSTSACEPFSVGPGSSTTATTVFDAGTNAAWAGTETAGAKAYDTATVTPSDGFTATGTVTYTFFTNSACTTGTGTGAGTVTLAADGSVPNSNTTAALANGHYAFQATYSGDSNYLGSTSACEPFSVGPGSSTTATTVFDAGTNAAWAGTETAGAKAYDTATVTPSDGFTATGTVTYTFFTNSACTTGTGTGAGTVTLAADGSVPNSNTTAALANGHYAFQATYSGDSNYLGSTSACEPFSVGPGSSTTATTVFDAGTNAAWAGTETAGAKAYDTATVTPSDGFTATGTVTYTFFTNSACTTGTGTGAGTVTLAADGSVPNSNTTAALANGHYAFQATYSGDSNYLGSTSACEPFSVGPGSSTTATTVFDAGTNAAWAGTETAGAKAYDTATVTPSDGFTATGTVTYTFFTSTTTTNTCTGTPNAAGTVTLAADGSVPNSNTTAALANGHYAFQATYSGDSNYLGSTSACEPFSVGPGSSTTATTVFDAGTNAAWAGTETAGAKAYDTATVTPSDGFTATGTVTYTFFTNSACTTGTGTGAGTVTLAADGSVPNSNTTAALANGHYAFQATYSGDSNYLGSTSACEPFSVGPGSSTTATTVFDAGTNAAWAGTETAGAKAYDTATVTPSDGFTATGTVTYTFFTNSACTTGTGTGAGTVTLAADGSVPNSNTTAALANGHYAFQATYSGDSNYLGSTSACEPFSVGPGSSTTATTVFDAGTNAAWAGTETAGAKAYDTATVTPSDGFTATGTVTYTFFTNSACTTGTGTGAGTVTLAADGSVPNSNTTAALANGHYAFQATYSGDSNYLGSTSACEPFSVGPGSSTTATTVFDAGTNAAWAGTETAGAKAYDTATVTPSDGFTATGTVTYTFFTNSACTTGTGTGAGTVTLAADGSVPNSNTTAALANGHYAFQATYSGDSNYLGSTSACEPFSVGPGSSTTATTVFDAGTNAAWAGTETAGAKAYDTATVTPSDGFTATGTVTYTFFTNSACTTGTGTGAGTVTLAADGSVPNSNTTAALANGHYAFQATYSGDSNYLGSTSACEPFSVGPGSSTTATTVFDAGTNAAWAGTETAGAKAYDTATVTPSDGFTATGTVTYTFFTNSACTTGTGTGAGTVTLAADGSVPNSNTTAALANGHYAFQATYSGDSNYLGSTSACEPFSVGPGSSTTATTVFDAGTNAAWAGTETAGAKAYDTATVTPSDGFTATGTVTYTFFTNSACTTGTGTGAGTVTLAADGSVPNSNTTAALANGHYAFQATYSGDSNYLGSTSACEPFSVGPGSSTTATTVFDAGTNAAWAGTETAGAKAYDTATVTPSDGFTATGTVTYTFFTNSACTTGTGTGAGTVTLAADGSVPNSNTTAALANGHYAFQATYSGDSNYLGSTSACEPFSVGPGSSTTATTVFDAGTNAAWAGTETAGAKAYDTATVTPSDGFTATGTVTYTFFTNSACTTGTGTGAGTVTLAADGSVPNSNTTAALANGHYAFQATYSGDSNYLGSTSACEPFTVIAPAPVSQITPTQTTCSQFASGTAPTLSQIQYSVKSGKISQVNPGVLFYWVKVTVGTAGAQTFTITQTVSEVSRFLLYHAGSNAYTSSCNTVKGTTITQSSTTGTVTVKFTAGTTGTYYIGVKYTPSNVIGEAAPAPSTTVVYTFSTTGVAGSTSTVSLVRKN